MKLGPGLTFSWKRAIGLSCTPDGVCAEHRHSDHAGRRRAQAGPTADQGRGVDGAEHRQMKTINSMAASSNDNAVVSQESR